MSCVSGVQDNELDRDSQGSSLCNPSHAEKGGMGRDHSLQTSVRVCCRDIGGGGQEDRLVHVTPAWYDCLYTPIEESLRPSEKSLCSLWQTDPGQQEPSERKWRQRAWWVRKEELLNASVDFDLDLQKSPNPLPKDTSSFVLCFFLN